MNPLVTLGIGILIGVQYARRRALQDAEALAQEAVASLEPEAGMQGRARSRRELRKRRRAMRKVRRARRDARRIDPYSVPICGLPSSQAVALSSTDPSSVASQLYA